MAHYGHVNNKTYTCIPKNQANRLHYSHYGKSTSLLSEELEIIKDTHKKQLISTSNEHCLILKKLD